MRVDVHHNGSEQGLSSPAQCTSPSVRRPGSEECPLSTPTAAELRRYSREFVVISNAMYDEQEQKLVISNAMYEQEQEKATNEDAAAWQRQAAQHVPPELHIDIMSPSDSMRRRHQEQQQSPPPVPPPPSYEEACSLSGGIDNCLAAASAAPADLPSPASPPLSPQAVPAAAQSARVPLVRETSMPLLDLLRSGDHTTTLDALAQTLSRNLSGLQQLPDDSNLLDAMAGFTGQQGSYHDFVLPDETSSHGSYVSDDDSEADYSYGSPVGSPKAATRRAPFGSMPASPLRQGSSSFDGADHTTSASKSLSSSASNSASGAAAAPPVATPSAWPAAAPGLAHLNTPSALFTRSLGRKAALPKLDGFEFSPRREPSSGGFATDDDDPPTPHLSRGGSGAMPGSGSSGGFAAAMALSGSWDAGCSSGGASITVSNAWRGSHLSGHLSGASVASNGSHGGGQPYSGSFNMVSHHQGAPPRRTHLSRSVDSMYSDGGSSMHTNVAINGGTNGGSTNGRSSSSTGGAETSGGACGYSSMRASDDSMIIHRSNSEQGGADSTGCCLAAVAEEGSPMQQSPSTGRHSAGRADAHDDNFALALASVGKTLPSASQQAVLLAANASAYGSPRRAQPAAEPTAPAASAVSAAAAAAAAAAAPSAAADVVDETGGPPARPRRRPPGGSAAEVEAKLLEQLPVDLPQELVRSLSQLKDTHRSFSILEEGTILHTEWPADFDEPRSRRPPTEPLPQEQQQTQAVGIQEVGPLQQIQQVQEPATEERQLEQQQQQEQQEQQQSVDLLLHLLQDEPADEDAWLMSREEQLTHATEPDCAKQHGQAAAATTGASLEVIDVASLGAGSSGDSSSDGYSSGYSSGSATAASSPSAAERPGSPFSTSIGQQTTVLALQGSSHAAASGTILLAAEEAAEAEQLIELSTSMHDIKLQLLKQQRQQQQQQQQHEQQQQQGQQERQEQQAAAMITTSSGPADAGRLSAAPSRRTSTTLRDILPPPVPFSEPEQRSKGALIELPPQLRASLMKMASQGMPPAQRRLSMELTIQASAAAESQCFQEDSPLAQQHPGAAEDAGTTEPDLPVLSMRRTASIIETAHYIDYQFLTEQLPVPAYAMPAPAESIASATDRSMAVPTSEPPFPAVAAADFEVQAAALSLQRAPSAAVAHSPRPDSPLPPTPMPAAPAPRSHPVTSVQAPVNTAPASSTGHGSGSINEQPCAAATPAAATAATAPAAATATTASTAPVKHARAASASHPLAGMIQLADSTAATPSANTTTASDTTATPIREAAISLHERTLQQLAALVSQKRKLLQQQAAAGNRPTENTVRQLLGLPDAAASSTNITPAEAAASPLAAAPAFAGGADASVQCSLLKTSDAVVPAATAHPAPWPMHNNKQRDALVHSQARLAAAQAEEQACQQQQLQQQAERVRKQQLLGQRAQQLLQQAQQAQQRRPAQAATWTASSTRPKVPQHTVHQNAAPAVQAAPSPAMQEVAAVRGELEGQRALLSDQLSRLRNHKQQAQLMQQQQQKQRQEAPTTLPRQQQQHGHVPAKKQLIAAASAAVSGSGVVSVSPLEALLQKLGAGGDGLVEDGLDDGESPTQGGGIAAYRGNYAEDGMAW